MLDRKFRANGVYLRGTGVCECMGTNPYSRFKHLAASELKVMPYMCVP